MNSSLDNRFNRHGVGSLLSLLSIVFGVFIFSLSYLEAATRTEFISLGGGQPYMVAIDDPKGTNSYEPGLYARSKSGDWEISFKGKILLRGLSGGFPYIFTQSALSQNYTAVIIWNGKITIIDAFSRQSDPKTYICLTDDHSPIVDPMTRRNVDLPEVLSAADLGFYENNGNENLSLMMTVLGKTAAKKPLSFIVPLETGIESGLKVKGKPFVLDYEKVAGSELPNRVDGRRFKSIEILRSLQSSLMSDKPSNMVQWYSNLLEFQIKRIKQHTSDSLTASTQYVTPQIDLNGNIVLSHLYAFPIANGLYFIFDPWKQCSGVYQFKHHEFSGSLISRSIVTNSTPIILGEVASKLLHSKEAFTELSSSGFRANIELDKIAEGGSNLSVVLAMTNGKYYLLTSPLSQVAYSVLPITPTDDKFLIDGNPKEVVTYLKQNYLFVSWKGERKSLTSVFKIGLDAVQPHIVSNLTLSDKFFTAADLERRVATISGKISFDLDTESVDTEDDYNRLHKLSNPHVNIDLSLSQKRTKLFIPEPQETIHIDKNILFKRYASHPQVPTSTGIYFAPPAPTGSLSDQNNEDTKPVMVGQILKKASAEEEGNYLLGSVNIDSVGKRGSIKIGFFAIHRELGINGKVEQKSARFAMYSIPAVSGLKPKITEISGEFDFSQFDDFMVLDARLKSEKSEKKEKPQDGDNEIYKDKVNDSQRIVTAVGILKDKLLIFRVMVEDGHEIEEFNIEHFSTEINTKSSTLNKEDVLRRLLFDREGNPYYILTPDLERNDPQFLVRSLKIKNNFKPENPTKSKLKLKTYGETFDVDGGHHYDIGWKVDDFVPAKKGKKTSQPVSTSVFKTDIFPELRAKLDSLVSPSAKPKRMVVIVPPSLKQYAMQYPKSLRSRTVKDEGRAEFWSKENKQFVLFDPTADPANTSPSEISQDEIFKELGRLRKPDSTRRVLMVPLHYVLGLESYIKLNSGDTRSFDIILPKGVDPDDIDPNDIKDKEEREDYLKEKREEIEENTSAQLDHAARAFGGTLSDVEEMSEVIEEEVNRGDVQAPFSYLLSVDGKRIQPDELLRTNAHMNPSFSQLWVGSSEEWSELQKQLKAMGLSHILEGYEVVKLEQPDVQARIEYCLKNIFEKQEVKRINYQISLKGLSTKAVDVDNQEKLLRLLRYLVQRSDSLSVEFKQSPFDMFIKVFQKLKKELSENIELQRKKVIDRGVVDNIFASLFPIPLNLELLHESDPLKVLSRPDIAFIWKQAGYEGSPRIAENIAKQILKQLETSDALKVPASIILIGKPGTGKTRVCEVLEKVCKLKRYRMNSDSDEVKKANEDANYLFVKANNIRGRGDKSSIGDSKDMITLDAFMEHLDTLLSSIHGNRAWLVFDDLHLAPEDVKSEITAKIRSLLDNATYTKSDGDEMPTRNLVIISSLNSPDGYERLKKHSKNPFSPSLEELVVAGLAPDDGNAPVDKSWVSRHGLVLDLDIFPRGAKGATLLREFATAAKSALFNKNTVFLLPSPVVRAMADGIKDSEDARGFLSTAISSMAELTSGRSGAHIFGLESPAPSFSELDHKSTGGADGVRRRLSEEAISKFVDEELKALPLSSNLDASFELAMYLSSNFRWKLFDLMVQSFGDQDQVDRNAFENVFLLPLMQALSSHMDQHEYLHPEDLSLDPSHFGFKQSIEKKNFNTQLEEWTNRQYGINARRAQWMKVEKSLRIPRPLARLAVDLSGFSTVRLTPNLQEFLSKAVDALIPEVEALLMASMDLDDFNQLPLPEQLANKNYDRDQVRSKVQLCLKRLYLQWMTFTQNMLRNASLVPQLDTYSVNRIFLYLIDEALFRQPWGKLTIFSRDFMEMVAGDVSLGSTNMTKALLFESAYSPLISMDPSSVKVRISKTPLFEDHEQNLEASERKFERGCRQSLIKLGRGE